MSKIGIDVSSYQGTIDWKTVKAAGVEFAILKVIKKDLLPDKQFERNWAGCELNGVVIQGVYNYSYAVTIEDAVKAARAVLKVLAGRKTMVWLDVEDNCQKNLGRKLIDIINAYGAVIEEAGLKFGVYTGQSFFNAYIKKHGGVKWPLWIARYGSNNGTMQAKYQPQIDGMIGWQFTSRGSVPGISGNVDLNIWYAELEASEEPEASESNNPYQEPTRLLYRKKIMQRGNDVKWLQYELIRHGCLAERNAKGKSNIDGILGDGTATAIGVFQNKVGINVDKKCGPVTREFLKK